MTSLEMAVIGVSALIISVLATAVVRGFALSHNVIDVPNERSSHLTPTPRGGGVAIVVATTAAVLVLFWSGVVGQHLMLVLVVGGLMVACVGFADDHWHLSVRLRFAVQLAAAAWALIWLGGLDAVRVGDHIINFGRMSYVLGALGIVWALNLFNFMDGIDGLAASEAVFVAVGAALLGPSADSPAVAAIALIVAAACCGFLIWNWPPARIFLGDVGSGYLGYVIIVLALSANRDNPVALWIWLILGGAFFIDATVTLLRRLLRGERVYEAHRCHAYQWLARRWGSHGKATLAFLALNVFWLLPCAVFAVRFPRYAAASAAVALGSVTLLAIALGSGRNEYQHLGQ